MEHSANSGVRPLTVVYRAVGDLIPDPRNARTHSRRQVDQIAASIARFGFSNPILVDGDRSVIAGHGRLLAARLLGMIEVPTIALPGLSDAQRRALRIADNRIALGAGWDFDILKVELAELATLDVSLDLTLTGFSAVEIDRLTRGSAGPGDAPPPAPAGPRTRADDGSANPGDAPPPPVEPRTQPGDIWTLGDHRIGCGDGRDRTFLARLIGAGEAVDAAFLDPLDCESPDAAGPQAGPDGQTDEATRRASLSFLKETLGAAARASRAGAIHFVRADWRRMEEVSEAGRYFYGEPLDLCVWTGKDGGTGPLYRSGHELLFVWRAGDAPATGAGEPGGRAGTRSNVWDHRAASEEKGGDNAPSPPATAMPAALIAEAMRDVTRPGGTVLATLLGSGSALIAAERSGRRLRGADPDPARVDAAVARWAAATGGTAALEPREPAP